MLPLTQCDKPNNVFSEIAYVVAQSRHTANHCTLRLHTRDIAAYAKPGQYIELCNHPESELRRSMSIIRADSHTGYLDLLYEAEGKDDLLPMNQQPGDLLQVRGPLGNSFKLNGYLNRPLLIGIGRGIPPMLHLTKHIKKIQQTTQPLVLLGSDKPFPFTAKPSRFLMPELPDGMIASMPLLEDWGIASRLCNQHNGPGCFDGSISELLRVYLQQQESTADIEVFCCGPIQELETLVHITQEYHLSCEVSLMERIEEFGCLIGNCAGCDVKIHTENDSIIKQPCLNGPVFSAAEVFPAQ